MRHFSSTKQVREPGDCFDSIDARWFSVQGMNGIIHRFRNEDDRDALADKYKKGKVRHGLMEI